MPRGDKAKYTDKQKRQAEHIKEGYKERGVSEDRAAARAWATVNKLSGGGKKSGSGRKKPAATTAKQRSVKKKSAKPAFPLDTPRKKRRAASRDK